MFVASYRGSEFDCNFLSNRLTDMGQDQDLHIHIEGLENSMKLILVVFNIIGVKNTRFGKKNIKTYATNSLAENPKKNDFSHEFGNESIEKKLKKN